MVPSCRCSRPSLPPPPPPFLPLLFPFSRRHSGLVEYIVRCVENERSEVSVVRAALACLSRLTYLRDEDPPVDAILALGGMEVRWGWWRRCSAVGFASLFLGG